MTIFFVRSNDKLLITEVILWEKRKTTRNTLDG